ncbi:MAG TPA: divergent PAP2 family protein [Candidatus Krumholzibacterium sp.]|nr:divergent PAP2 family protein [Candidatus Krumholzibacterium sp.]
MIRESFIKNIFVLPILTGVIVQAIKCSLYSVVNRRFEFDRFFKADGMPNLQAGVYSSLMVIVGIKYGYSSILFTVTAGYSLIIIHDTMRLKRHKASQTDALNMILSSFQEYEDLRHRINRVLQFRPLDVIIGVALGIIITYGFLY